MTNDVLPLESPGALPMYACILNAQGRYLHDLFLHRTLGGSGWLVGSVDGLGVWLMGLRLPAARLQVCALTD